MLERTLPLFGIAAALIVWWLASMILWSRSPLLQSFGPGETGAALIQLFQSGEIWPHVVASVRRVLIGLVLAAGIGIPMGILFGVWPRVERSASVLLQLIRMISPLSWMPLAVMAFGVESGNFWPGGVDRPTAASQCCPNRHGGILSGSISPSLRSDWRFQASCAGSGKYASGHRHHVAGRALLWINRLPHLVP
jgi:hypothetical protein